MPTLLVAAVSLWGSPWELRVVPGGRAVGQPGDLNSRDAPGFFLQDPDFSLTVEEIISNV